MKKAFTISYLLLIICALSSCVGGPEKIREDDKLTQAEYQALLRTARSFITSSDLKVSGSDREFIQNRGPSFKVHYTGYKSGKFFMTWKISEYLSIMLSGEGPFLEESCRMKISIIRF